MAELPALLDEFFAFWWAANPSHATAVGIHTHDHRFESWTEEALAEQRRGCRGYLERLERLAPADAGEAIDRDLVAGQLRWRLYELETLRTHARNPICYIDRCFDALYLMATRGYGPAGQRARAATDRLLELGRVLDEARHNLSDPAVVHARTAAELTRSGLALLEYVLPVHLGAALEDDVAEFARWDNALRAAERALVDFARWLEHDVAASATADFALGRAGFEAKLRALHCIDDSAADLVVYAEGLKAETERELERLARQVDSGRHWRDVVARLKDEHPSAGELLDAYRREMARAREFVVARGLAEIPRGEELEITPTPEYLRPLIPFAAYHPPAPHEAEQKGVFFVTPPPAGKEEVLRAHSRYALPITALHEAYPGHHLQLTRSNRAATEPRRVFHTSVFAEGWALYCEEMMWEEGFYEDPRERLLQLADLLWRACRVIVDVGLHVDGWTPERAVDVMVNEAGLERASAEVEVRRYCADPTQPLSYAVGKREILALRERYRERAGPDFRLRDFHDALLSWGTIPPALIARALELDT